MSLTVILKNMVSAFIFHTVVVKSIADLKEKKNRENDL